MCLSGCDGISPPSHHYAQLTLAEIPCLHHGWIFPWTTDAPGSRNRTDDNKDPFSFLSQANLTHLPRSAYVPGIGSGMGKCPYDPLDNSTAIYVEEGNPGNLPALVRITAFSGRRTAVDCMMLLLFPTSVVS